LAEALINKLVKTKRVELGEGDHLVVAQITRVRSLKATKKIAQVDEDPNQAFGDVGSALPAPTEEEVEIEDGEVSEETEEEAEATSTIELPEESGGQAQSAPPVEKPKAEPAPKPTPKPAPAAPAKPAPKATKAAATPPPGPQADPSASLSDDDPLADMGESEGDIVQDDKPKEKPPAAAEGGSGDDLDEIF
jgi:hypothetical protein